MRFIKLFIILTAVQTMLCSGGWAVETTSAETAVTRAEGDRVTLAFKECMEKKKDAVKCNNLVKSGADPCDASTKEYLKSLKDFNKTCSDAKIGTSDQCRQKIKDCYEASSEEDSATQDAQTTSMMDQLGVSSKDDVAKKCPTKIYKDWKDEFDKAKENLPKLTDKLADAQEKKDDIAEKQRDGFKAASEKYNTLLKDQRKKQLEDKSAKREALLKQQENTLKANEEIMKSEESIRMAQAEITSLYFDKASKLAMSSDAIAKYQCSAQLQKTLKDMPKVTASSFNGMALSGGSSFSSRKDSYRGCVQAFIIGRQKEVQLFNDKIDNKQKMLASAQSQLQDKKALLISAKNNESEALQDLNQAEMDALSDHNAKISEIQQDIQNIASNATNKNKTADARIASIQKQINLQSNEFNSLNNEKPSAGTTKSYSDADTEYGNLQTSFTTAAQACGGCKERPLKGSTFCGKDGTPDETKINETLNDSAN